MQVTRPDAIYFKIWKGTKREREKKNSELASDPLAHASRQFILFIFFSSWRRVVTKLVEKMHSTIAMHGREHQRERTPKILPWHSPSSIGQSHQNIIHHQTKNLNFKFERIRLLQVLHHRHSVKLKPVTHIHRNEKDFSFSMLCLNV